MGMVFITGVPESGRDSIVRMILTGSRKNLPPFDYLSFDDMVSYDVDRVSEELDLWSFSKSINHMHRIQGGFQRKLKEGTGSLKKGGHAIVNGYFTLRTPGGYLPLLSKESARFFKPDVIVIIEIDTVSGGLSRKLGGEKAWELKYHQDINLNYAISYSALTRSAVKVVRAEYGKLKDALKEMTDIVTLSMQ
jgi:adenylate kinase